jgi:hypothetical protein
MQHARDKRQMHTKENLKGTEHMRDLGADGKIILNRS